MEAIIDRDVCIGCELCPSIAPAVFVMEDAKAVVQDSPLASENEDVAIEAAEACPVNAINIE